MQALSQFQPLCIPKSTPLPQLIRLQHHSRPSLANPSTCCSSSIPAAHRTSTSSSSSSSSKNAPQPASRPRGGSLIPAAGFGFGAKSKGSSKANSKDCPCGSGKLYSKCCEVIHKSAAARPSPEQLLRARYSAFVKKQPKFLRATSHPDNPALKGSSTTLEDGTTKQCTYEEDMAMTFLAAEFTGFQVLGSQLAEDSSSCSVDCRATFKRLITPAGKHVGKPEEEVWVERATLVKDDDGNWLVKHVQQMEAAAVDGSEAQTATA